MRGILPCGGAATRVRPALDKIQLLVYDKPAIYYFLTSLMIAGCREILVVCGERNVSVAEALLRDAPLEFGVSVRFIVNTGAPGTAGFFRLPAAKQFIGDSPVCVILDDVYHGGNSVELISEGGRVTSGATILAAWVPDPQPFGWLKTDDNGRVVDVIEKPKGIDREHGPFLVQAGMYFYGPEVVDIAGELSLSGRGEYEISDLSKSFLTRGTLDTKVLKDTDNSPFFWEDAGTPDQLLSAGIRIRDLQEHEPKCLVGSPHIQGVLNGWVEAEEVHQRWSPLATQGVAYYRALVQALDRHINGRSGRG